MRTSVRARNQGVASKLLSHLIQIAKERGYSKLNLETGSIDFFRPARKLYEKFGFAYCEPFANYKLDPNSKFMELNLRVRVKINSQIDSGQAPVQQGAKTKEYLAYAVFSERR